MATYSEVLKQRANASDSVIDYKLNYEEYRAYSSPKQRFNLTKKQVETIGIWSCNIILLTFAIVAHFVM